MSEIRRAHVRLALSTAIFLLLIAAIVLEFNGHPYGSIVALWCAVVGYQAENRLDRRWGA